MDSSASLGAASRTLAGLAVGLGVAVAGWQLAQAHVRARGAERYVTVKGLSSRAVVGDRASWTVRFTVTADDFEAARRRGEDGAGEVEAFLASHGVPAADLRREAAEMTDHHANPYTPNHGAPRYALRGGVTLHTSDVAAVERAARDVNTLLGKGLLLEPSRPTYAFTSLNAIKPEMLAEATANARRAAQEFAQASGSQVGDIRRAHQGIFSVSAEGSSEAEGELESAAYSLPKTLRVVTTVEFLLE